MAGQGEETSQGVLGPGEGHRLTARGSVMAFKAVAAQTGGDFSLMERTLPPGGRRPPAHRHVNCSEAFFVLEGRVCFELDGRELTGGPGDFLLVPRGAAHTFGNAAGAGVADGAGGDDGAGGIDVTARLLVLHAPAMDGYFEELHRLWASGEPPSRQEERALMARYGMEPPGGPGPGG